MKGIITKEKKNNFIAKIIILLEKNILRK